MDSHFECLKAGCLDDWQAYVTHPFVEQLAAGSLPLVCFKQYLGQECIFLMHFPGAELEPDSRIDYLFAGRPKDRGAEHVVSCRLAGGEPADGMWPSDYLAVAEDALVEDIRIHETLNLEASMSKRDADQCNGASTI